MIINDLLYTLEGSGGGVFDCVGIYINTPLASDNIFLWVIEFSPIKEGR